MQRELDELDNWAHRPDAFVPAVSGWSIHRQVDHCAVSIREILGVVHQLLDGGGEVGGRLGPMGTVILLTGWIPRGKAQAPEVVLPAEVVDVGALHASIAEARRLVETAHPERGGKRFLHPALGPMNARQWLRFARIHTRHHVKIVRDIARAQGSSTGPVREGAGQASPRRPG